MWKEYSISYIKNNKITSVSLMVAALISAMFLSLITSVFYNMWIDNINQIVAKEGDWQAKIIGSISEKEIESIQSNANVKNVITTQTENGMETLVYFYEIRSTYEDMPKIARLIEVDASVIQYHDMLLSEYFIFAPDNEHPPMLLAFYVFVMVAACISLILIIRNAFLVSMQSRLHQLGILQSIGAAPGQIKTCLLQEALGLCLLPIIVGIGCGAGLCFGAIRLANGIAGAYRGENAEFNYHIGLFLITFIVSMLTILCSAWLPARNLSKVSPLQAIKGEEEQNSVKKVKKFLLVSLLFGIEGELAGKSLYVRRKALRTATLSLTLSFFAFSIFLCSITLSGISTKYTYFERYKDAWDIMVTVKDQNINDIEGTLDIDTLNKAKSCCVYQKALAYTWLTEGMLSDELQALGSISEAAGSDVSVKDSKYQVKVPIVILDDTSFKNYCESIGVNDGGSEWGMVTINRIWDNIHSNFRYKKYIPFIKEQDNTGFSLFQNKDRNDYMVKIPVLAYTDELPVLREEYANYALVQVMSASTWQNMLANMSVESQETYINVQTATDAAIWSVQTEIEQLLSGKNYEIENRAEEKQFNEEIKKGYILIMGGLCGLLAIIGLANVFSNTLGYIYQRKREFSRYVSVGLSPRGIKKILCIEALIIGGKPIVITVPLTIVFVIFAAAASYINPMEFLESMPIVPLFIFACMIMGCVALAYYIGGRKIYRNNIIETLKNDILS
ncbi:ABC transporter permease [Anaerocolumna xylanovorans]|uniref:Putative ABC transport system permease protein n=1 Tax=Anaerocolumna xylanovorans DSM 12503 TaxID=1121345 RepID=A0A1M7XY08_9FIRM|nr:ABC transporter permease [Anaerocolumna xylanovorans]SHO43861.1 putative ABC transport system permease protein [Anaerocolumna xylanovorans DSM 12503]